MDAFPPTWRAAFESLFAAAFTVGSSDTTWLEIAAAGIAIAMVLFNMRVNPIAWPLAITSSLLYVLVFARSKLYGDAALQLFFVAIACWGWRQWLRGGIATQGPAAVRRMNRRQRWLAALAVAVAWPATGFFLKRFTDTDVPWWDAFPTAASVVGQVLLGRKFIENWVVWLVVNVVGAALFASKELWLTALLYGVFALMSALGWRAWRQLPSS